MKGTKNWLQLLVLLALVVICSPAARADTETVDGLTWTFTVSDGKASVGGPFYPSSAVPTNTSGAIVIPSKLGGCLVTGIGASAFSGCSALTGITIPDSVTDIGYFAFADCSALTNVTIPAGVTNIGDSAFSVCTGVTAFDVAPANPSYMAVDGVLFSKDGQTLLYFPPGSKTKNYVVPDSVTNIEMWAFYGSGALTNVVIPGSVASIGNFVFEDCSALAGVTIGNGVTSIGKQAFAGCSVLAAMTIPDSVTHIGSHAFSRCSGLYDTHTFPGIRLVDGWVVGWTDSLFGTVDLTGVRGIVNEAFSDCTNLTGVVIPDGVVSIGYATFHNCIGLASVTLPDSVSDIGSYAFWSCSGLTGLTIPGGVTSIEDGTFSGCNSLTSLTIPDRVTSIGSSAFSGCSGLTDLTIPDSVTSVEFWAFYGSGLTTLHVPASWKGTTMLDSAGIPAGCTVVYGEAPETEVTTTGVPYSWIDENAAEILEANGGDHEAAAAAPAANGQPVWECYVAGLSTTDAEAAFKLKSISIVDGKPVVTWAPDLNEGKTIPERAYKLLGKQHLSDDNWQELSDEMNVDTEDLRFFRVRVELP